MLIIFNLFLGIHAQCELARMRRVWWNMFCLRGKSLTFERAVFDMINVAANGNKDGAGQRRRYSHWR